MHSHGIIGIGLVPEWDQLLTDRSASFNMSMETPSGGCEIGEIKITADEHTLNTILELDNIFSSSDPIYDRCTETRYTSCGCP